MNWPVVDLDDQLLGLATISLADLVDAAELQERMDRKYVLDPDQLTKLISGLGRRLAVLEIDARRTFRYESVYFDTPILDSFYASAYGRRQRFKVRTRTYLDSHDCMLEVKTRGARKITYKDRQAHDFVDRNFLGRDARAFVDHVTGYRYLGDALLPTLTTQYDRSTLVDLDDVTRLTIDSDLRCIDGFGNEVAMVDRYIVETKSAGPPSTVDRMLWQHGIRPEKISKFGVGMVALNPELPSNKWHRTIKRHFLESAGDQIGSDPT